LVARYIDLWRDKTNEKSPAWAIARLGSFLKDRVKADGEEEVLRRVDAFFTLEDRWVRDNAYSVSAFQVKYNALGNHKAPSIGEPEEERKQRRLEAIAALPGHERQLAYAGLGMEERAIVDSLVKEEV
jgi:hypothetical protein